jgi:CheY-like chemotaxis protein
MGESVPRTRPVADVARNFKIRRLQPLRILLSAHDHRYVRVTAFLLASRGYSVASASPADAVQAAERHRADVVLLESNSSRALAAQRVAQLSSLVITPAVVLVTDTGESLWTGQRCVEKWAALEELVAAIEAASLQPGGSDAEAFHE